MTDDIKTVLGTRYLCKLPAGAVLTQELWDIIALHIDDPQRLQQTLDELYFVPPRDPR